VNTSDLNSVMYFGKYKGKTIREVLLIDAEYLYTAIEEEFIIFDDELTEVVIEYMKAQGSTRLIINE